MEGLPKTHDDDVMLFIVAAIETAAKRGGTDPSELTRRLAEQDIIRLCLMEGYDALHTQSVEYVADYLLETLHNYENDV